MRFENIRAVVARKTIKSLKESTWNTIKTVLKNWGLKEEVNYRINNLEGTLTFWNDSVIIMKEMVDLPSDPNFERFGSSEYTIAMIDEVSEISEKAVEVLFSRLRWRIHETFKTSRMFMSTNPTTNWVRSRFVQDENGDKVECREGEAYIPFSVFDNPDIAFRQSQYFLYDIYLFFVIVYLSQQSRHSGCDIEVPDGNDRFGRIVDLFLQVRYKMSGTVKIVVNGHIVGFHKIPVTI